MIWKCENGYYLSWGHNNSHLSFSCRNPVWIRGGIECDGKIYWSQPEIILYADNIKIGMSYPDWVESGGEYWISETEKEHPRIHKIDKELLNGIWNRLERERDGQKIPVSKQGLVLETTERKRAFPKAAAEMVKTGGLTLDFEIDSRELTSGTVLLDNRTKNSDGLAVLAGENGTLRFEMNGNDIRGNRQNISWTSDVAQINHSTQRITIIIDNNPRIISFFADGQINDGNGERELGWGRFELAPENLSGTGTLKIHPVVKKLRIYNRYLHAFEL
jgi:hypothetical protein